MYLRISFKHGLFYELRHNTLFAKHLGIPDEATSVLAAPGEVTQLSYEGNLVCKAAEEITDNISLSDATLKLLLDHFSKEKTLEIILLVSWFNMLIRYIESTWVPYEPNLEKILSSSSPMQR